MRQHQKWRRQRRRQHQKWRRQRRRQRAEGPAQQVPLFLQKQLLCQLLVSFIVTSGWMCDPAAIVSTSRWCRGKRARPGAGGAVLASGRNALPGRRPVPNSHNLHLARSVHIHPGFTCAGCHAYSVCSRSSSRRGREHAVAPLTSSKGILGDHLAPRQGASSP